MIDYTFEEECAKWEAKLRAYAFILEARQDSRLAKIFLDLADELGRSWPITMEDRPREYLKAAKYLILELENKIKPKPKEDEDWL